MKVLFIQGFEDVALNYTRLRFGNTLIQ